MFAALAGAACEDGPDQSFAPAPPNAGAIWNGADASATVGSASQSYDASTLNNGGQNANTRCNAIVAKQTWTKYFSMNASPPGLGAGLDIAGGPNGDGVAGYQGASVPFVYDPSKESWSGATLLQAENLLCQGTYVNIFTGINTTLSWGETNEFSVLYNGDNLQITDLLFTTGYVGTMNATSRDGTTTYSVNLQNLPISKTVKGSASTEIFIPWGDTTQMNALVNELYDAFIATYAPTFPADKDCIGAGHCEWQNNFTGGGNMFFVPIATALYSNTTIGTQEQVSIIGLVQVTKLKLLPYATASVQLQLDSAGVGSFAQQTNVVGTGKTCKYTLGMPFSQFDSDCVQVYSDAADGGTVANETQEKKLFGSLSHDNETYHFDVVGVDPEFSATLTPTTVVTDTQRPSGNDTAIILNIDQNTLGPIANDYTNNDTTQPKDLHGIGLVTLEWANLVQQYMRANHGVNTYLGDTDCIANPATPGGGKVCSGIEGIVTTAPPALVPTGLPQYATMASNAYGAAAAFGTNTTKPIDPNLAIGLKPTTWYSVFKTATGYIGGQYGFNNAGAFYFDAMQDAVSLAYPAGKVPQDISDRRFFFEQWCLAFVKYLETADKPQTTIAEIDANLVDPNNLFFDNATGGFENAEYVDRLQVNSLGQDPTSITITTNLLTSVLNNFQTQRYLYRPEKLLYQALETNTADKPGSENALLSNIAGSPVLVAAYSQANPDGGPDPINCSLNEDPTQCNGIVAPIDPLVLNPDAGAPSTSIYAAYQPAFGHTFLNIAANGSAATPSPMVVDSAPYQFIASAMVTVPKWTNPYDPSSATANDPTVSALATFFPKSNNVGFPVLIDGSRDKFYQTNEIDLPGTTSSGSTVQGNVDYEYATVATADGGTEQAVIVRAIETPNYLGLVFACSEPSNDPAAAPGQPDVLGVRMYDNANTILNWISAHPGAINDCGIFFKKSIYGNYFDFISFNTNGVRFGLNPGYGGSVVTDVTIFDPNIIAGLGQ